VPGTNRFAYLFQEFGGLSLHHRALLVETSKKVAFYAVHMCSIAETKAPAQGADGSVGLKPNFVFDDLESSSTGKQSTFLERSRRAWRIGHFADWEPSSTSRSLAFLTGSRRA
jgi:hypothetical protein